MPNWSPLKETNSDISFPKDPVLVIIQERSNQENSGPERAFEGIGKKLSGEGVMPRSQWTACDVGREEPPGGG